MSPRPELVALSADLAAQLERVSVVVSDIERLAGESTPGHTELWALAAHLHSFYTGCEAIMSRAVERFEGLPPAGPDSHVRLLQHAALDLPGVRPPVITQATVREIDRYRAFRHFFRHTYGVALAWEKMAGKVRDARRTFERFASDIASFREFLKAASSL